MKWIEDILIFLNKDDIEYISIRIHRLYDMSNSSWSITNEPNPLRNDLNIFVGVLFIWIAPYY